jgi:polyhydroxyalkanoate synthesis regulator phasin
VNVANGKITPSEAQHLMTAISSQARIIEVDELERRVAELEHQNGSKT